MLIGVTGASGGLGRRFCERMAGAGVRLRALVRKDADAADLRSRGVEVVLADLLDRDALAVFAADLDVCYHLAAQVARAPDEDYRRVNVEGTRALCEALRRSARPRLVYCSTMAVRQMTGLKRLYASAYARSKREAEQVVRAFEAQGDLAVTVVYPGYIYGPHDRHFFPAAVRALQRGIPFMVRGGERDAPIVFTDDLCDLLHLAGTREVAVGRSYFSVGRSELGIHGFLRLLAARLGCRFPARTVPRLPLVAVALTLEAGYRLCGRGSEPPLSLRTISFLSSRGTDFLDQATADLGWRHQVAPDEGIERTLAWWRSTGQQLA